MAELLLDKGGLVTFNVKVEGTTIPDEVRVHSIEVEFELNRISSARITILDGDASKANFEASSSDSFIPGSKIAIELGYDTKNKMVFEGVITNQDIHIDNSIGSSLVITARDAAVAMIVGRKSLTFSKKTDSDIMSSIIGTYSGVEASITATTTEWPQQVQNYATDWDFVLSRAEANGLLVAVQNGKLSAMKPDADTTPVVKLEYGTNIYEFSGSINSTSQLGSVKSSAWDYDTQAIISGEGENDHPGPGNLSSKKLSEVIGLSAFQQQTSAALSEEELSSWSKAQLVKSEYSKITGEVKIPGTSLLSMGKFVTLAGLGTRFSGDHIISRITHSVKEGSWFTEIQIGISPLWFTQQPDVMAPPAAGLLPGTQGLYNGTVKKIFDDPDSQYRILVDVPLFDAEGEGLWARLTNFYSTSGAGAFFLPEVGDEVIIGFLNEDPRFPIILGSVYSKTSLKPFEGLEPNENNTIKAIVSKSGIELKFDDENKVFTITTPNKNTAIFSDEDTQITIQDQNSNSIVLSDSGIVIKSPKNITIEADQNIAINGTQGVSINSSAGDVEINGMNIKNSADVEFSAEGSASAQVQGGGELTLKGAMVMIN